VYFYVIISTMTTPFALPDWLQYLVAAGSVISSFGVVVALFQIAITKEQFKTQLKSTSNQFTLLNQGYLNLDTQSSLFSPELLPNSPMRPGIRYETFSIKAMLENVGNTPIVYHAERCKIYFNDKEVFDLPVDTLGNSVLYPKQKTTFGMGTVAFQADKTLLSISQINELHITCKFKFNYHDFHNNHIKTIERLLIVNIDDHRTGGIYKNILDKI
jgi:hypothetical protein